MVILVIDVVCRGGTRVGYSDVVSGDDDRFNETFDEVVRVYVEGSTAAH